MAFVSASIRKTFANIRGCRTSMALEMLARRGRVVTKLSPVTGSGRETQNYRHLRTCVWSSHLSLRNVNGHRGPGRGGGGGIPGCETHNCRHFLDLALQKCQHKDGGGSWSWNAGPSSPLDLLHVPARSCSNCASPFPPKLMPSCPASVAKCASYTTRPR